MEQIGITVNLKYQYISLNHTTPLNLSSAFTPLCLVIFLTLDSWRVIYLSIQKDRYLPWTGQNGKIIWCCG